VRNLLWTILLVVLVSAFIASGATAQRQPTVEPVGTISLQHFQTGRSSSSSMLMQIAVIPLRLSKAACGAGSKSCPVAYLHRRGRHERGASPALALLALLCGFAAYLHRVRFVRYTGTCRACDRVY